MQQTESAASEGDIVEVAPELYMNTKAQWGRLRRRAGPFQSIKSYGEPLESDGTTADQSRLLTVADLDDTIARKSKRFKVDRKYADSVWLFLIDCSYPADLAELLACSEHAKHALRLCIDGPFKRVLLFRFSAGITDLTLIT